MNNRRFIVGTADRTRLRAKVLGALQYGRKNAITGNELARTFWEPDDRRIRAVILELIKEGEPIAAAVSPPSGFYLVGNGLEAAEYIRILEGRIREDKLRLEYFRKAVEHLDVPEQPGLFTEVEP